MTTEPAYRAQLLSVIAHARAGALDRAWQLYAAMDLPGLESDPAALSVKGRLLKDLGLRSSGAARRSLRAPKKPTRLRGRGKPGRIVTARIPTLLSARPNPANYLRPSRSEKTGRCPRSR